MSTSDELGILWATSKGHEEVSGVECFAYFRCQATIFDIATLDRLWSDVLAETSPSSTRLGEDDIFTIKIKISRWPDDENWRALLEKTLQAFVESGARVAWCGGYDCSWSLDILDPHSNCGNVYAGYSQNTGFICNSNLSEPMRFLTDSQLGELHRIALEP